MITHQQRQLASLMVAVFITGMLFGYHMAPDYDTIMADVVYEIKETLKQYPDHRYDPEESISEDYSVQGPASDSPDSTKWVNGILSYCIRDSLAYVIYVENGDTLPAVALYQEEVDTLIRRLYGSSAWDEWFDNYSGDAENISQLLQ